MCTKTLISIALALAERARYGVAILRLRTTNQGGSVWRTRLARDRVRQSANLEGVVAAVVILTVEESAEDDERFGRWAESNSAHCVRS